MSFLGKIMSGSNPLANNAASATIKKDPNAPQLTLLEKHLVDAPGPVRQDGSDKFYGFENYGSTCYCNSIIQCLYYSAPFRENVIRFPSKAFLESHNLIQPNGAPLTPRAVSTTPYPNLTSPARKVNQPNPPAAPGATRPEENKELPDYKKRLALAAGPVLDMTHDNSSGYGMEESLFTSLRDIFEAIIANPSRIGVVSPHRFLEILRRDNEMFRSAMHQDAHEFLNLLLNQVVDNVDAFVKQHPIVESDSRKVASIAAPLTKNGLSPVLDTRWLHDLFEGRLTSETRCLTCETTSQRDEPFLDLSVDLSPHTSVTACLRKFSEEEMLCERNKFHCDNCGGLQEAEKRMKIKRLPRILALHLKRFKYTEDLQRLQKLFHRVVYPFHLRLFNTTDDAEDPDRLYELYAVVVHIGGGPYHGHYVSIIKTEDRGWLLFDDELVEPVDKNYVLNFFGGEPVPGVQDPRQLACAYVLFYQETTLEAMLRDQAAEGQPHAARRAEAVPPKDVASPLRSIPEILTPVPTASDAEPLLAAHTDPLAHTPSVSSQTRSLTTVASTSPPKPQSPIAATPHAFDSLRSSHAPPSNHVLPPTSDNTAPAKTTALLPPKTKKELRNEEKERKTEEKERKAAEKQALKDSRREDSAKHTEAIRKADEDLKRAMDASRQSAANDARRRTFDDTTNSLRPTTSSGHPLSPSLPPSTSHDDPHLTSPPPKQGGLARLKNGSMSLRSKNRFFSRGSTSDRDRDPPATPTTPKPSDLLVSATSAASTSTPTVTSYIPSAPASTISISTSARSQNSSTDPTLSAAHAPLSTLSNGHQPHLHANITSNPRPTTAQHAPDHHPDDRNSSRDSLSALPRFFSNSSTSNNAHPEHDAAATAAAAPGTPKKHRFSLGRKKSAGLF